jgi:lipopolysaccharide transport system permease protein
MWEYRELLYFLSWRDISVRYKQAALGVAWAVIQPVMTMLVLSIFFGKLAKLPSDGKPYPLFIFAGLLPWQLFASSLLYSGTSLVSNSNLIKKVYFPRLIIPMSAVTTCLVDFAISFAVLIVLMFWYHIPPTLNMLMLPLFVLLAIASALSVGLWLSALDVQYRDVQYIIPFLVQVWMFASPVAYSANHVPKGIWRVIYGLNPMAGTIQGFRWALLGGNPPGTLLAVSCGMVLVLLVGGLFYFVHMEKTFADVI